MVGGAPPFQAREQPREHLRSLAQRDVVTPEFEASVPQLDEDRNTSNSQPGEDGSKPCSISQRAASKLRSDHHARITSRST
jgi:hypothetical protein